MYAVIELLASYAGRPQGTPQARILLEQIGLLGYRVTIAKGHVEAVNDDTGEQFIVRGDDLHEMADELAGMVGLRRRMVR